MDMAFILILLDLQAGGLARPGYTLAWDRFVSIPQQRP
jgi:hypothetical protein